MSSDMLFLINFSITLLPRYTVSSFSEIRCKTPAIPARLIFCPTGSSRNIHTHVSIPKSVSEGATRTLLSSTSAARKRRSRWVYSGYFSQINGSLFYASRTFLPQMYSGTIFISSVPRENFLISSLIKSSSCVYL